MTEVSPLKSAGARLERLVEFGYAVAVDFSFGNYFRLLSGLRTAPLRDFGRSAIYLRHDIDLCPEAALRMARKEAEHGYSATYMFIPTSPLYELTEDILRPFVGLGHEVALHFDYLTSDIDDPEDSARVESAVVEQCDLLSRLTGEAVRSISFHRPIPAFLRGPDRLFGLVNAYSATLMEHYRSDSAGRWRSAPHDLATVEIGQLLTHPIWWGEEDAAPAVRLQQFRDGKGDGFAQLVAETVPGVA